MNTNTTQPSVRKKAGWIASAILVAGLSLAGCSAADASSGTTSTSTSSSSTTASTTATADATTTTQTISDTTAAAQAFLDTLSDEQRAAVLYDYDDETKTTSWSNFPVTFVERAGLNLADLT